MKNIRLFTLVLISSFLVNGIMAKETLLRLNLKKGEKYSMVSTMNIHYFSDASLTTQVMGMDFNISMTYTVLDRTAEGIHIIEAFVTKVKGNQNMSGMTLSYDSENPEAGGPMGAMLGQQIEPMLNKAVTFKINEFGEMVQKPEVGSSEEMFSAGAFASQMFIEMPKETIKEGNTWSQNQSANVLSPGNLTLNFTAGEISKKEVKLSYQLDESSFDIGDQVQDLKVESKGNLILDKKSGRILSNILNQSTKGSSTQMGEFFMVSTVKLIAV